MYLTLILLPASLKICIGIVQVFVMIEIAVRVIQTTRMLGTLSRKQLLRTKNLIEDVIASQKRTERSAKLIQLFVFLSVLAVIIWSLVGFIQQ